MRRPLSVVPPRFDEVSVPHSEKRLPCAGAGHLASAGVEFRSESECLFEQPSSEKVAIAATALHELLMRVPPGLDFEKC